LSPAHSPLQEQFFLPPPTLRDVIEHFTLFTVPRGAGPVVRQILPSFQVVLLLNLGDGAVDLWPAEAAPLAAATPLVGSQVLGPLKKSWHYRLAGEARTLAITFTLAGFFRLFQVPVDRLAQGLTEADTLTNTPCFAELWQQLRPVTQPARLMQLLAAFCLSYLRTPDPQQAELLAHLPLLGTPLNPLRVLAAASQRSERAMQLRFQKYLGFSAKEATRFLRFRRLITDLFPFGRPACPPDWSTLLEHYGYYDQSHLIHDFSHFLQLTPTEAARQLQQDNTFCITRSQLLQQSPSDRPLKVTRH
jgi:AraC-like DNA-binding protein